jgi:predicted DNA-binding protein (MmcQ/YjbR family)
VVGKLQVELILSIAKDLFWNKYLLFASMVDQDTVRQLALSLPEAEEHPHFENFAFKVKKKIFVTLNPKENRACVKLSELDQSTFCLYDVNVMYPVPNKWGKQGWTLINLAKVPEEMLKDAVQTAYEGVRKGKR